MLINFVELPLIIILGLCAGSFISMASYRFALKDLAISKFILNRSFCPHCHNILKAKNLIPLFSWIFQKGRCSFCHAKISKRYPLIELSTTIIFVIIYQLNGTQLNFRLLILLLMAITLMIMIVTDLENYFIPDLTQIILGILAIIYHLYNQDLRFWYYILSAGLFILFGFVLYLGFWLISKKRAIGIDDIKFFGVAGFLLGIDQFPFFMMISGLIGIIFGSIWQKITKDQIFPFAPALCISLMICVIFKDQFLTYFS